MQKPHKISQQMDREVWRNPVMEGLVLKRDKKTAEWKPRWLRLIESGDALMFRNQTCSQPSTRIELRYYYGSPASSPEFKNTFILESDQGRCPFHFVVSGTDEVRNWLLAVRAFTGSATQLQQKPKSKKGLELGHSSPSKHNKPLSKKSIPKPVELQSNTPPEPEVTTTATTTTTSISTTIAAAVPTTTSTTNTATTSVATTSNTTITNAESTNTATDAASEIPTSSIANQLPPETEPVTTTTTTTTTMTTTTTTTTPPEQEMVSDKQVLNRRIAPPRPPAPPPSDPKKVADSPDRAHSPLRERKQQQQQQQQGDEDPKKKKKKRPPLPIDPNAWAFDNEKDYESKLSGSIKELCGKLTSSSDARKRARENLILLDEVIDQCIADNAPAREWVAVPNKVGANQSPMRMGGGVHRDRTPEQIALLEQKEELIKLEKLKERFISKQDPYDLYELQTEGNIGKGSVGEVIFAEAKDGSGVVAIKKLQTIRREKDRLPFILREIEIISSSSHPNIVRYINSFNMGNELWVVMEYMSAGSLYDIIKYYNDGVRFSEADIAYITHELLVAIEFLHSLRRIHRDIKVDNVLLSLDGSVKLADFGTAVQLTFQKLRRTTMAGTPYYMAPELIQRIPYGEKVDIWSVGISVIELAEGQPPFYELDPDSALEAVLDEEVKLSETIGCSDECRHFVDICCLQRDPQKRWSATQLLTEHPWLTVRETKESFADFLHELYGRSQHDTLRVVGGKLVGENGEDTGCIIS